MEPEQVEVGEVPASKRLVHCGGEIGERVARPDDHCPTGRRIAVDSTSAQ
jgi:hypothetical protein